METKVQMKQSLFTEDKIERQRLNRKLRHIVTWSVGTTAVAFLLMFFVGAIVAWADPSGWPAYRVGAMTGGITAMCVMFMAVIASIIYLVEG